MPCQGSFDLVGATRGGAVAYCERESGSFRTPAGHGPSPQTLQASIPGKLYDVGKRYRRGSSICGSGTQERTRCSNPRTDLSELTWRHSAMRLEHWFYTLPLRLRSLFR